MTSANCPGEIPGLPRTPNAEANCSSANNPDNSSRTRIANFNDDLDAFASMVCEHAASVARFRHKVLTKQAEEHGPAPFRPAGRFQSAGGPSKSRMGWDEMVERIDRLRARKWEMPRFEAERYQGLCERAMEDLES